MLMLCPKRGVSKSMTLLVFYHFETKVKYILLHLLLFQFKENESSATLQGEKSTRSSDSESDGDVVS